MGVTAVSVNGLAIHDGLKYAVGADTLTMLEAMSPHEPVLVEMANRPPVYVRSQIQARPITLVVFLLRNDANDRKIDYDALLVAINPATPGLKVLSWTDGGTTKTLRTVTSSLIPSNWFSRASAELVAPNPEPIII